MIALCATYLYSAVVSFNYSVILSSYKRLTYQLSEFRVPYRHVMEVMHIALTIYNANPSWYKCTRDDVITAAFVHDFDKLGRYVPSEAWRQLPKYGSQMFQYDKEKLRLNGTAETISFCACCGLILSPLIINAITFHHGGWSVDASAGGGALKPLAVLLHFADMLSVVNNGS